MKYRIGLVLGLALLWSSPARAEQDDKVCGFYASVGQAVAEYVLPMTVKQMIEMVQGKNAMAEEEMATKILSHVTPAQLQAAGKLSEDKLTLLSEDAGENGLLVLMNAQASTSQQVNQVLYTHCASQGHEQLIANRIKANSLTHIDD